MIESQAEALGGVRTHQERQDDSRAVGEPKTRQDGAGGREWALPRITPLGGDRYRCEETGQEFDSMGLLEETVRYWDLAAALLHRRGVQLP